MESRQDTDDATKTVRQAAARSARWTYNTEVNPPIRDVPELVMLGSDEIRKAVSLTEHEHPGCFEFVLIERGKASWELDGIVYETLAGDVFHTHPGEKHRGGFNVIEPCKFWWVIISAPHHEGWLRLSPEDSLRIKETLMQLPRVASIGLQAVDSFRKLKKALTHNSDLQSVTVRHALLDIILSLVEPGAGAKPPVADDLLRKFDKLVDKMGKEPEWRPTVEEMASFAGISASHFYRTFQEYTGEPPMNFVERLRVKEACRRLAEHPDSVTAIAFGLGYQTSQHFSTVFKRFMGVSPTEWRSSRR